MSRKDKHTSDQPDEKPYVLGRPELNDPPEEIARLEPQKPSDFRSHAPDLLTEESRLLETIRNIQDDSPENLWEPEDIQKNLKKPILFIILGLTLLVTGSFFAIPHFISEPDPLGTTRDLSPPPESNFMESASAAEVRASSINALKGFMNASTFADRCKYVANGAALEERMRTFYQRPDAAIPNDFGQILDLQNAAFQGTPIQIALVSEANGRTGWSMNLVPSHDRMLIDWESSVAYGELSWQDFVKLRPKKPVAMRVYLKPSYRFAPPLYNEREFIAYELTFRASNTKLFAYVPRGSELAEQLTQCTPKGAQQPVHLKLRWPSNPPDQHSLIIDSFLHNFWIAPQLLKATPSPTP